MPCYVLYGCMHTVDGGRRESQCGWCRWVPLDRIEPLLMNPNCPFYPFLARLLMGLLPYCLSPTQKGFVPSTTTTTVRTAYCILSLSHSYAFFVKVFFLLLVQLGFSSIFNVSMRVCKIASVIVTEHLKYCVLLW